MNYIKELNAFRHWLTYNTLSTGAIALWHALISVNNGTGWKKQFTVPNPIIQQYTGLSKKGLMQARTQLVEHGLIRYEAGNRSTAPTYEMISLVEKMSFDATEQVEEPKQNPMKYQNEELNTRTPTPEPHPAPKMNPNVFCNRKVQRNAIKNAEVCHPFNSFSTMRGTVYSSRHEKR